MNIRSYIKKYNLINLSEIDKIKYLTYYFLKEENKEDFQLNEIIEALFNVGFSKPNLSRLKQNITKSKYFIKGKKLNSFKLAFKTITELEDQIPDIGEKDEEVISLDSILPNSLYANTRGYIEKLGNQINSSYENNIFDGCAILMRRLLEILLIQSYESHNQKNKISENGGYKNLSGIINITISDNIFSLSKEVIETLDTFRQLGNFAAHKIFYNTKKKDIESIKIKYRLTIEELLYASKLKN